MTLDLPSPVRRLAPILLVAGAHFAIVCVLFFAYGFATAMAGPGLDGPAPPPNVPVIGTLGSILVFPLGLLVPPPSAWMLLVAPLNSLLIGVAVTLGLRAKSRLGREPEVLSGTPGAGAPR